jgi:hypothetical protein
LILTGPDDIRARFAKHATDALVAELAALRPRPGSMIRYHTLLSLRGLGAAGAVHALRQGRGLRCCAMSVDG